VTRAFPAMSNVNILADVKAGVKRNDSPGLAHPYGYVFR
jgi:hypothetical protein